MKRFAITPRNNWQKAVEGLGFGFHTTDIPYWDETAYYAFGMDEVLAIEKATAELWTMCLNAVQHVMDENLYEKFAIPERFIPYIEKTWAEDHPAIYGRFDLCYKDGQIKLLEFNADTPTSLFEAGIVQWFWLQDFDKKQDQFNSIHEKLIDYWKYLKAYLHPGFLHFTCLKETLEDLTNTEYLRDCARQVCQPNWFLLMILGGMRRRNYLWIWRMSPSLTCLNFIPGNGWSVTNLGKTFCRTTTVHSG